MIRLVAALAARPRWAALALLGLLGLAAPGWLGDAPASPWTDEPEWEQARETEELFRLGLSFGWVALFGPVDSSPRSLNALRTVEAAVENLPWIDQVLSPLDLPGADLSSGHDVLEHPLVGPLLSAQGGFLLPFTFAERADIESVPQAWVEVVAERAQEALAEADCTPAWEAAVTGIDPVMRAQARAFTRERQLFTALGVLLVLAISVAAFRNLSAVILAGAGPILGVGVAVGIARGVGLGAEGFTGVVLPLLVLTIGFTDSLHLVIAAARAHRAARGALTPGQAAARATRDLAWPCFLTSMTTAIGFGSLSLASHPVVVQFGQSSALGTLLTFACVILVVPLLAHTPLGRGLERTRPRTFRPRVLESTLELALRRPRATALLAVVLAASLLAVASQLGVDKRVRDDLAQGSSAVRILTRSDAELGGVFPVQVRIDWEPEVPIERVVAASDAAARILRREPGFTPGVGPAQLVQGLAHTPLALAALPPVWRNPFLNAEARTALVHARLQDVGTSKLVPALERVRASLRSLASPGLELALVGTHLAHLETMDRVARELGYSLGAAALLILLTLGLAFRSAGIAAASAIPNVLPVAAAAAGLRLAGGGADLSSLTALTLALGIAADDTIHVLAQWRAARGAGLPPAEAARRAVQRTLPALAMTTLTMIAAFGMLLTSSIPIVTHFGLLVAVTLATAFLADVWFLPALLVVLARRHSPALGIPPEPLLPSAEPPRSSP